MNPRRTGSKTLMNPHTLASRLLVLAALGSTGVLGCDSTLEPTDASLHAQDRGALLYDLTEEELAELHAAYVPEEALALTRARLSAPFDCSLYGDFCDEVGAEAAEAITGEMIDLARDGAPVGELEALLDARSREAVAALDREAHEAELAFRGSSTTVYHTQGNFRLGVRNGVTTPVVGDRRAWTQAITWHFVQQNAPLPAMWYTASAAEICVDTGVNTQTFHFNGQDTLLESIDPSEACTAGNSSLEISTWHDRLSGSGSGWFDITVHGCATASINGLDFSKCAPTYSESF
jgi:hypothetical protein